MNRMRALTSTTPRYAVILLISILILQACGKEEKHDATDIQRFEREIGDSIKAGNFDGARKVVRQSMSQAADSDMYYEALIQEAFIDYYAMLPDSMLPKAKRTLRYLQQQTSESALRNHIQIKAAAAMGAYNVLFTFNADSCEYYQKMAMDAAAADPDPSEYMRAMGNLADTYRNTGKLDLAADLYTRALNFADSIKASTTDIIPLNGGLAAVYTGLAKYDEAIQYWDRQKGYWAEMIPNDRFNYYNNRGNTEYLAGRYPQALKSFLALSSMLDSVNASDWEKHFCDTNLTDVYLSLEKPDSARARIQSNYRYFTQEQPNPYAEKHIETQMLRLALLDGDMSKAAQLVAKYPVDPSQRYELRSQRYKVLEQYYTRIGDWKNAYQAKLRYTAIEDSVRNENVRLSVSALKMGYERDRKVLNLQMEVGKKNEKITRVLGWLIIAMLFIVAVISIFILRMRSARLREARMVSKIRNLRGESIRARITPHFIYNALNHELARRNNGEESQLDNLIQLLRQQQTLADHFADTLSTELSFVEHFVNVKSQGMHSPLDFTIDIAPDVDAAKVMLPTMTVQIFVENAFKHGFSTLPEGVIRILKIKATRDSEAYHISVANNAMPHTKSLADSTRQGLRIIDATLQLLNERNRQHASFSIQPWHDNPQESGCIATLIIPINFKFESHGNTKD